MLRPRGVSPLAVDELLSELAGVPTTVLGAGGSRRPISGITLDSRTARPGDLFAALPGEHRHGATHVTDAVLAGAVAVLTDEAGAELVGRPTAAGDAIPVVVVDKPRAVVGPLAAAIYGRPSDAMDLVGITGTNGKTTTAYLTEAAMAAAGRRTVLLGTIETRIAGEHLPQARTTPEATELQAILAVARERGVGAGAMEVSSHALSLGRVAGTKFRAAVFTNLSQDHLDFHENMDAYFAAKLSMFRPETAGTAVICVDDDWGVRVMERTRLPHVTYSVTGVPWADWHASDVLLDVTGSRFRAGGPAGESVDVAVRMPGLFNVANALAALAAAVACGIDPSVAAGGIGAVKGVPGRLERIDEGQDFAAFVDFAHTPEAVRTVLRSLRELTSGRLVVVLGCGGDRDRTKRSTMARVAAEDADTAVFTSDNPRSEDPVAILAEMTADLDLPFLVEPDRRRAIALALDGLSPGDTLLVAGKGHETGQESNGVVTPFDDREVLRTMLRNGPGPGTSDVARASR